MRMSLTHTNLVVKGGAWGEGWGMGLGQVRAEGSRRWLAAVRQDPGPCCGHVHSCRLLPPSAVPHGSTPTPSVRNSSTTECTTT